MKKILLTGMLGLLLSSSVFAFTPNNIVVFGDSLSDVGNNTWIEAIGTPLTSLDDQANRFAWPNYLAKQLTGKPATSFVNATSPKDRNRVYAYASSDTSKTYLAADWPNATPVPLINPACEAPGLIKNSEGVVQSSCVPGVLKQVELYLSSLKNRNPDPNSVFIFWAGANDLFYKLALKEPPDQIIATAVNNLVLAKNMLIQAKVDPKQIYFLDLPNLALTPYAIKYVPDLDGLKKITMGFNGYLTQRLTDPTDPTHIDSTHVISMFKLLNDIVGNPKDYNITNWTESCVEKSVTPLCKGFLFYDMKHPSAAIHKVIAETVGKQITHN